MTVLGKSASNLVLIALGRVFFFDKKNEVVLTPKVSLCPDLAMSPDYGNLLIIWREE